MGKKPYKVTIYNDPENPFCIDLYLTNNPLSFQYSGEIMEWTIQFS